MKYVVRVSRAYRGSPERADEYLAAIHYDPYCRGEDRAHSTTSLQYEAFKFRERAAAEMAAVYVSGRVVKLTPRPRA